MNDQTSPNFLIDSWSYSKISEFSRNEKAFEMSQIYGHRHKSSASSVAGTAYHKALDFYFSNRQSGVVKDIADLQIVAFNYIEEYPANYWKIQKTVPTVDEGVKKAIGIVSLLLKNFFSELPTYIDRIKDIIGVEMYFDEFVTINGVDIILPCHALVDLIFRTHDDKVVILDHKSKSAFTDEQEFRLSIGIQGMTYVKCVESRFDQIKVDQIWFVENKYSANKDKNVPQLNCFKIELNDNVRRLYEALIYEPLRRMLEAVSNPDYVYLINDHDNFVDRAEIYEFWCKTMTAEVEEFNISENKKELISQRLRKIRDTSIATANPNIIKEFRENAAQFIQYDLSNKNMTQQEKIQHILRSFGIITKVAHVLHGCSSVTCLLDVSAGVKITSIQARKLDIANVLDVASVRVSNDLVVYEGRSYVGVEFSKKREGYVFFDPAHLAEFKIPIGIDNYGNVVRWDLDNQSTPHMLLCGGSGSGKSVSVRSTIEYSILAGVDQIEILDPKFEFKEYNSKKGISVYNEIEEIEKRAEELVELMNTMIKKGITKKIVIVLDEFADAYMMAKTGKQLDIREEVQDGYYAPKKIKGIFGETMSDPIPKMKTIVTDRKKSLEENIQSLLQKGRSSGFRLILATQRADAKTISGSAKVNLTVQICFRVQKQIDSIVVIDEPGGESLSGRGDGLFRSPEYTETVRFQAFYKP